MDRGLQHRKAAFIAGLRDARGIRRKTRCNRLSCYAPPGLRMPTCCSTRPTGHTTGQVSKSCWMKTQWHVWTASFWQVLFDVLAVVGCGHVSGLLTRFNMTAGPDEVRGSDPIQVIALLGASPHWSGYSDPGSRPIAITSSAPRQSGCPPSFRSDADLYGWPERLIARQERPADPCHLVRQCHGHNLVRLSHQKAARPLR